MHPKVKYALLELEQLLNTGPQGGDSRSEAILKQTVRFEIDRIMQTLALDTLTLQNEEHVTRYIQYHQYAISRLMDKVVDMSSQEESIQELFEFYYSCLEELLSFIEYYFPKYFDQDVKAPQSHVASAKKSAKEDLKRFQIELTNRNADPRLIDLVLRTLKSISDKSSVITYRKVLYVKEIQNALSRLLDDTIEINDIDESLRQVMYYLNYNSHKVLTYHAHYITSLLDRADTRADKIERLSFLIKKVNQAQVKPGIKYHPHGPSLKDQLNNYLVEELEYQQRLQQGSKNLPDVSEQSSQEFKLRLSVSVSQMAYLLKILLETKLILNNNLSQILQFLVKHVVTKRSETISAGSFRSKYYDVENSTRESVRNMLLSLVHHIDKS